MKVFIHEYTHRIDRIIGQKFATDTILKSKFTKGVSADILERRSLYDPNLFKSISHLKVKSLIDDNAILIKGLKKRRTAFTKELDQALAGNKNVLDSLASDDYFIKLNKQIKTILTDNEIRAYLKSNNRSFGQAQIYQFKLKLKHKVLYSKFQGGYDRQFSGDFNDYIGAITKETLGGGHGKTYYNRYATIFQDGNKKFTEGQTLEAWANHSAMTLNPHIIDNLNIKNIERKLMSYFTPNTTKGFDDVVNNFNDL